MRGCSCAMCNYFFHVKSGNLSLIDPFGTYLPSIDAAIAKARNSAAFLAADVALEGGVLRSTRIEVIDDSGNLLACVPFAFAS